MPDVEHTPNLVGHTIARRYELQQIIGRGGHGLVFRALDRLTNEVVAVKMLTDSAAQNPQLVERLKREQRALVELAGTSAVRVYDLVASAAGKLCLVMELLDGIDLEQRLEELEQRRERIAPEELVLLLSPIVDTLERAHAAGILHRDLKPANVFLVSRRAGGGVRLLDFGLARMQEANPLTAAGTIVGSPSYIAPEVWKGRTDQLDRRVDVYSFGVIVFRALAGRLPFELDSLRDKFIATTTAERPSLCELRPALSPDMDHWVQQVLAIHRDARFDSVRAAYSALLGALGVPSARPAATADAMDGPIESSRIVSVGVAEPVPAQQSVFAASMPERSLVSEWLAKSAPGVETSPAAEGSETSELESQAAPGLFDPGQVPTGERSLVSEWLAKSELDVEPPATPEDTGVSDFDPKTAPGLFDPTRMPAGERSLVSEWLAQSDIAVEHPPEPPAAQSRGAAKKKPAKKKTAKAGAKKKTAKKKAPAKKKTAKKKTAKKKTAKKKKAPAKKKAAKKKAPAKKKKTAAKKKD